MSSPPFVQRFRLTTFSTLRLLAVGISLLPLATSPQAALAQNREIHSGQIRTYHLNGAIPDRGACVQMTPRSLLTKTGKPSGRAFTETTLYTMKSMKCSWVLCLATG